ncbi:MAG: MOSC domain-containing protein [Bacteroidia bacterium]|nr:MOSC domain-containing protein [Bacteroidia bacterium]
MQVISTNIAQPKTIFKNGRSQTTGIFKKAVQEPVYLEKEQVRGDEITNRKVHGGEYKACYLFSAEHYNYWQKLYPHLEWEYGMFGENLTVEGFDETKVHVGDIFRIGEAEIQITQPREPCSTFGAKMGDQGILKKFIDYGRPGTYCRVLKEGYVRTNDKLELIKPAMDDLSIVDLFRLIFDKSKNKTHLEWALRNSSIANYKKEQLTRH